MLPCALEGSASSWFQTLQPPCNSLTAFKKQLTDRFRPILYGMPLMGIRQDTSETSILRELKESAWCIPWQNFTKCRPLLQDYFLLGVEKFSPEDQRAFRNLETLSQKFMLNLATFHRIWAITAVLDQLLPAFSAKLSKHPIGFKQIWNYYQAINLNLN